MLPGATGRKASTAASIRSPEGLAAWRDEGVDEVMCRQEPASLDLVERIARAAQLRG
jgi:collagenase-like PrtC family protease